MASPTTIPITPGSGLNLDGLTVTTTAGSVIREGICVADPVTGTVPSAGAAPVVVTVGTSSALALAANNSRKGFILVNTSANTISLAFGSNAAVLNSGVTLYPGGTCCSNVIDCEKEAINAIASAASSTLSIQEFN